MAFEGRKPARPLTTAGVNIDWVDNHQYLGVWLDSNLRMREHVQMLEDRVEARTNILHSLTRRSDGASHAVRKVFYTHAIRSIIDYSAPCLILASTANFNKLERLQNRSLRLILSAPLWTKVLNLRAETHLPAIGERIKAITAELIVKMSHSPRPFIPPARVFAAAERDPALFTKKTWARDAAAALREADILETIREKGEDAPHPTFAPSHPWRPPLPTTIHD
ncbi:putative RNA-directed DNA polymerase from transposon BS [Portunus trituberculatus]|uniref:Putative RNA-directed DNA polymerase from transposon BS n=1 Tax=Portunus trituberculatus TaxID=210409 RepID=A0A5B7J0N0_PORTR|nr:putative RNA-directed DNA polymerase from transposon BS [Portunus trituberculatus]